MQLVIAGALLAASLGQYAPSGTGPPIDAVVIDDEPGERAPWLSPDVTAPWYENPPDDLAAAVGLPPLGQGRLLAWLGQLLEPQFLDAYYDPFSRQFAYGGAAVQPYRLGWYSYHDMVWMPRARASVGGHFQDFEWNAVTRYAQLLPGAVVFAWTGAINSKFWTGPPTIDFPPYGDQLISDFQLSSDWGGPWNWQVGLTPQVNSDFQRPINSNALMCDVRAVAFYRPVPQWTLAAGAAFWNRASDHLIPYGGVIWAPNDRWEFRLLYPRSRISYYVGKVYDLDAWGYLALEYNVDAYQMNILQPHVSVRGELSDYRFLKGFNVSGGIWSFFVEGGVVFDRHVRFRGGGLPDFGINDGFVLRTGLMF